jgi:hypothetical protein
MRSIEYISSDLYTEFFRIWTVSAFLLSVSRYKQFSSNTTIVTCVVPSNWSADGDSAVESVILRQKGALLLCSSRIRAAPVITVVVVIVVWQSNWSTGLQCLRFIEVTIDCVRVGRPCSTPERESLLKFTLEFLLWIKKQEIVYFIQTTFVGYVFWCNYLFSIMAMVLELCL